MTGLHLNVVQSGQVVKFNTANPVLRINIRKAAQAVGFDRSTPRLRSNVFQTGSSVGIMRLQGPEGPAGPAGIPGPGGYYAEYTFATPATTWTITLPPTIDPRAVDVDCITPAGDNLRGDVERTPPDQITISFYYPTTGTARVYR